MKNILPAQPSLEQLKKQAKDLLKARQNSRPDALTRIRENLPPFRGLSDDRILAAPFRLHDAQSVIAREYGFASWTALKKEVEQRLSAFPDLARQFVLEAVQNDGQKARDLLRQNPALPSANLWTALAGGDLSTLRPLLAAQPGLASAAGGPKENWFPLHYLSFSRLQMDSPENKTRFADCARLLLEAGADPNAAWEHSSWPGAPLRSLYGATGENNNPHLARVLLQAGAMADDGESIYHAAENFHLESLEVLAAFGASSGLHPFWKNTPLFFLLGYAPSHQKWPLLAQGIRWLLEHGCDPNLPCEKQGESALHVAVRLGHSIDTFQMLLDFGAEVNLPRQDGKTPLALARINGLQKIAAFLLQHGAAEPELSPKENFFAAAFAGNEALALQWKNEMPGFPQNLEEEDHLAVVRAAEKGNLPALRILLDFGFDISFKGSRDWGATPLHLAAWHGRHEIVRFLLDRGAPVNIRANRPEDSFPIEWAAHGSGFCRNPEGNYPALTQALLQAGAVPGEWQANMASPEVASLIRSSLHPKNGETP